MSAHRVSRRTPASHRASLGLILAFVALLTAGCASSKERWAEVRMQELSFQNLYSSVLDMLELEGYSVHMRLPDTGEIETAWLNGISKREVRGPSRRKVHVVIEPEEGPRLFVVRMRVEEQIIRKGGMLASGTNQDDDWEAFPDNFEDAEYLAAKLRALLSEYAIRVKVQDDAGELYR